MALWLVASVFQARTGLEDRNAMCLDLGSWSCGGGGRRPHTKTSVGEGGGEGDGNPSNG